MRKAEGKIRNILLIEGTMCNNKTGQHNNKDQRSEFKSNENCRFAYSV